MDSSDQIDKEDQEVDSDNDLIGDFRYRSGIRLVIRPSVSNYSTEEKEYEIKEESLDEYQHEFVEFENREKQKIDGTFFQPKEPVEGKKCVVFAHGNSCNQMFPGYTHSKKFLEKGFYTFCFDFPGTGNSNEMYITFGAKEPYTIIDVCDWLQENKGIEKFYLFGHSMGGFSTLYATVLDQRFVCAAHLCPYISIREFVKNNTSIDFEDEHEFEEYCQQLRKIIKKLAGFDFYDVDIMPHLAKITIPTVIGYCKMDYLCPMYMSRLIFNGLTCNEKEFVEIGTHHSDILNCDTIIDFLTSH